MNNFLLDYTNQNYDRLLAAYYSFKVDKSSYISQDYIIEHVQKSLYLSGFTIFEEFINQLNKNYCQYISTLPLSKMDDKHLYKIYFSEYGSISPDNLISIRNLIENNEHDITKLQEHFKFRHFNGSNITEKLENPLKYILNLDDQAYLSNIKVSDWRETVLSESTVGSIAFLGYYTSNIRHSLAHESHKMDSEFLSLVNYEECIRNFKLIVSNISNTYENVHHKKLVLLN